MFSGLYGNDDLKSKLINDIESGKFIHACIIEGGKGSGKHTLARSIAAALQTNLNHRDKVMKDISPDVIYAGLIGDRKTIGVDTVRDIKDKAYIKPNESEVKIFIVEDSHLMTVQAQNAFLKLLEEPPSNVYFILLCDNTANLLTTVKSRAVTYKMQIFNDDELRDYIVKNHKKAVNTDYLIKSANGRIGMIIDNMTAKKLEKNKEKYDNTIKFIKNINDKNVPELLLENEFPEKREEIDEYISRFMSAVRDITAYKNGYRKYEFFINDEDIEPLADKISMSDLVKLYDTFDYFKRKTDVNVGLYNLKIIFINRLLKEF